MYYYKRCLRENCKDFRHLSKSEWDENGDQERKESQMKQGTGFPQTEKQWAENPKCA